MFHHKVAAFLLEVWSLQLTLKYALRHLTVLLLLLLHLLVLEVLLLLHETL